MSRPALYGFFVCGSLLLLPTLTHAEDMAPAALNSLSAVPAALSSAPLMDQSGHVLGKVDQVMTDHEGRPSALSFRASNGRILVVSASQVSYDGKALIASSDQPQIADLIGQPLRTAAK